MAETQSQRVRIRLKAYDHRLLDASAAEIVETAKRTGAIVKGPVPLPADLDDIDVRELGTVAEGSDLWLRDRAAPDVPERNITGRVTGGLWSRQIRLKSPRRSAS